MVCGLGCVWVGLLFCVGACNFLVIWVGVPCRVFGGVGLLLLEFGFGASRFLVVLVVCGCVCLVGAGSVIEFVWFCVMVLWFCN